MLSSSSYQSPSQCIGAVVVIPFLPEVLPCATERPRRSWSVCNDEPRVMVQGLTIVFRARIRICSRGLSLSIGFSGPRNFGCRADLCNCLHALPPARKPLERTWTCYATFEIFSYLCACVCRLDDMQEKRRMRETGERWKGFMKLGSPMEGVQ
jgi:hypothetical protein